MKIKCCGAAQEVTGSSHLLEVNGKKILLDCGLFQGHRKEAEEKNRNFLFNPAELDAVLLSHAHIDHCGRVPLLARNGFTGPIYCTFATRDLVNYMLLDSTYIQEKDVEYVNKKRARKNLPPVEPLYEMEDTEQVFTQLVGNAYDRQVQICEGVKATFVDAGHILGSALIYLEIDDQEDNKHKTFLFACDLGRKGVALLRDPHQVTQADYVMIESTYGDRLHKSVKNIPEILADIVKRVYDREGKIIVPAFAVERTQEIVFHLNDLIKDGKIEELDVFVDSPLSTNVTEIFRAHPECYKEEVKEEFIKNQKNPFGFGMLKYISDVEDSKALNFKPGPYIIIASSGMCEFGRVVHHLKNNIEDPKNCVLVVGYMAKNTLGRKIMEKEKEVNIFGDPYQLNCDVAIMDVFSAHADRSDLIDYISKIDGMKEIFIVHGEENQGLKFSGYLKDEGGYETVHTPEMGQEFTI